MVAHLLNIEPKLAERVADGLGLKKLPLPADGLKKINKTLQKSPALSILLSGPKSFSGRKLGVLVTDGVDATLLKTLREAIKHAKADLEIIAPKIGGVKTSDGAWVEAQQRIDGGPSVLYDAVALLVSAEGMKILLREPSARDFLADAFAH
jgi:catalase